MNVEKYELGGLEKIQGSAIEYGSVLAPFGIFVGSAEAVIN